MLSIYGISCDSASCLRNDRMCGKRVSFMFTRSVFTLCYWKCLSYKDCVKGLHDNVLFTFSKKYTGQSRLYKHQEKHWLLLIPNSNLSLCWSSRYLFTWFTFTPVFMRTWSHMFALICVSVSTTLCKAPQLNQQLLHWSGLAYYMFSWFYLRKEALFQYNSS